ncbi:putative phage tail protein [Schleiferilactobacillus harbinensis]|uniref:DUF2313 domain-containing protein n=1 Tax=Schleiferilactobacillus harbinensis TaxID=304207 RepID=A0A5P8M3F2_9LACO|nr:putative phage tail protein [Schleiferilactobacillus harbinensis]QFR23020.1 DUF2313 domain-containing protein [Schleiferilactobacillus harbinensis]
MAELIRLESLLPDYYDDVLDMHELMRAEQPQLDELYATVIRTGRNQSIMLADVDGISVYEDMLGITPLTGADLETRRYDVLLHLLPPRPITIKYLRELLKLMGFSEATVQVDGPTFRIFVLTDSLSKALTQRLFGMLNQYVPVNLTLSHMVQTDPMGVYIGQSTRTLSSVVVPWDKQFKHWASCGLYTAQVATKRGVRYIGPAAFKQ